MSSEEANGRKRKPEESEEEANPKEPRRNNAASDDDDDGWIGPMPSEAAPSKRERKLEFEKLYLNNLPDSQCYERSFMHRDAMSFVAVSQTEFVITASCDGHIKFWKKKQVGIEFVKHFRAHLGNIQVR